MLQWMRKIWLTANELWQHSIRHRQWPPIATTTTKSCVLTSNCRASSNSSPTLEWRNTCRLPLPSSNVREVSLAKTLQGVLESSTKRRIRLHTGSQRNWRKCCWISSRNRNRSLMSIKCERRWARWSIQLTVVWCFAMQRLGLLHRLAWQHRRARIRIGKDVKPVRRNHGDATAGCYRSTRSRDGLGPKQRRGRNARLTKSVTTGSLARAVARGLEN